MSLALSTDADPIVRRVEAKWLPLQTLDQASVVGRKMDGVNVIGSGIIDVVSTTSTQVVLELVVGRWNSGRNKSWAFFIYKVVGGSGDSEADGHLAISTMPRKIVSKPVRVACCFRTS